MKREISDELLKWKDQKNRKPLLLEGMRQCGKTYILKEFGEQNFKNTVYFNFEDTPEIGDIFQSDLNPKRIIEQLAVKSRTKIEPGNTLIIFDEIQFCNRALTSLKYFCENASEYHIACAGSLLGIMLSKPYSFPVGKVDRLKMGPMNFKEFLLANSEEYLVEFIDRTDPTEWLSESVVNDLKTYLDYYFIVGGMPAAVSAWVNDKDIQMVDAELEKIVADYMDDFSKHASDSILNLTLIWDSIPVQLGKENQKFMFGHAKTGARAKDLENELQWLINAGLVHKVKKVDPPQIPLPMNVNTTSFKIYMADIGILRKVANISSDFIFGRDKEYDSYRWIATENYVLNELISAMNDTPYYWRSNNDAEVDFIAQVGMAVIPIEVKAGRSQSKSLSEYRKRYSPEAAVMISMKSGRDGALNNIPLYAVWRIEDHIQNVVKGESRQVRSSLQR
ncbi:MAG: AAA family ATPase [Candidatus Methanoplasma sp.]|jgi:predicted AAA+ superfamily ATPase|nr:AAA family ATPase [Candidatus Methanoplasma sp.]